MKAPVKRKTWNRREFTRNLGLATVAAPFVGMLQPEHAQAQVPGKAKYLMVFYTTGTHVDLWSPKGSSANSINFSEMNEPLSALKEDLILIEEMDSGGTADGHGDPGGLTGFNHANLFDQVAVRGRDSIERWLANQIRAKGANTAISELLLGGVATQQPSSFVRAGQTVPAIQSVSQAYSNIFSGAPAPVAQPAPGQPTGETAAAAAAERLLARRRSTLDQVRVELNMLKNQLGAQEAQTLDHHLSSIRSVENRLALQMPVANPGNGNNPVVQPTQPVMCNEPPQPGESSLHQSWVDQTDLAVAAFGCDLTRIACVQFGHHQEAIVNINSVGQGDWHNTFLHSDGSFQTLTKMERWVSQQFVRMCDQLKAAPAAGGGSLWDQTLVCWARDMGDAVGHSSVNNMRYVLTGGAGGYLAKSPNGRHMKLTGQPHTKLLFNLCEAMGVTDFSSYGHSLNSPLDGISA